MVAEDKVINIEILYNHLKELGVDEQTTICIDGQQAIDKCKDFIDSALHHTDLLLELKVKPIALCLLDFQMPNKNGIQVVQEVRQYIELRQKEFSELEIVEPTFVFLTAYKTSGFHHHLTSMNISECFDKPI